MTTNATNAATRVNDNGARDINIDDRIDIEPHVGGEGGRKMDDEDNNSDDCGEGYCITLYRTTTMMTNAAKALGLSRATMTVASVLLLLLFLLLLLLRDLSCCCYRYRSPPPRPFPPCGHRHHRSRQSTQCPSSLLAPEPVLPPTSSDQTDDP